jgi:hypothetical protein
MEFTIGLLNMAICTNCGQDTIMNYPLCSNCHNAKKTGQTIPMIGTQIQSVLSDINLSDRENNIKGRIAETLVEELFLSLGWEVFRYGMENTIPGVMRRLNGIKTDVAENIRRMPDFVVQDKNGNVYFIEVKFRESETFCYQNLIEKSPNQNYPYDNAHIVVVSKKHIKCLSVEEVKSGKTITPTSHNYLGNVKEFSLDKDAIINFCDFAVKFFFKV